GARLESIDEETRDRLKLEAGTGARIRDVLGGSTAEAAGFKAGDVLTALDGSKISGVGAFVQAIVGHKAGDAVTIGLRGGDDSRQEKVTLKARPLEKSDDFDADYDSVTSRSARLRTIVTRPKGQGKHPAVFLIQGIGVYSIDNPIGALGAYRTIVDDF